MKIIPIAEAFTILENASAVVIDNIVTYPTLADLIGESDNQFLCLSWTDDEGLEFAAKFEEGVNETVEIGKSDLWLIDADGERTQITILVPANLEDSFPVSS